MKKIVIWGASGHALIVEEILLECGGFEVAGFLDDKSPERCGEEFGTARILGGEEALDGLLAEGVHCLVFAFHNGPAKLKLAAAAKHRGFELITAVHPSASVSRSAVIGEGSVIRAQAAIGPGTVIGKHCLVGYGATISHDCQVGDGVHISSGGNVAGGVAIGRNTWVAVGASIIDGKTIGENSILGAGAVAVKDIPDGVVAMGVPAKVVKKREDS